MLLIFLVSCAEKQTEETVPQKEDTPNTVTADSSAEEGDFVATNTYDSKTMEDGKFESFYPDKTLKAEGLVTNGKREGVWTSYHPNGNKQSENEYVNGVLHGKTFTTFPSGQIMYIGYYNDGKYDGQWVYYNSDGTLSKEIFYEKGEIKLLTEGEDYNK
jgi:antitoxin component YwqK of YwqJK toxin-antitoxin module